MASTLGEDTDFYVMCGELKKEEAEAYRHRWQLVNAKEREELRSMTPEVKLRQLASLMASVEPMGWTAALADEEAEVRERWMRLKEFHADGEAAVPPELREERRE